jgi:hypothetical protein
MKMQLSGMEGVALEGVIGRCMVNGDTLQVDIRLSKPVGWSTTAQLTRQDTLRLIWLVLKSPSIWAWLLGGRR